MLSMDAWIGGLDGMFRLDALEIDALPRMFILERHLQRIVSITV